MQANSFKKVFTIKNSGVFKRIVLLLVAILLLLVLIHAISAATVDRSIEYTRLEYSSPKVQPAVEGYKIAVLTDLHNISAKSLEAVVENLNKEEVDVVLLGGDFPYTSKLRETMGILAGLQAADGIYGVEGNHDNWEKLREAMKANGIQPLNNTGVRLQNGLYLAGVQDYWNRYPNVNKATSGAEEDDFVLLLCHNPDVAMKQDMAGVDLMFSGHTHGGHVTFFGVWRPFLRQVTEYPREFGGGWAQGNDDVDIYVSRGTGPVRMAPRVFARPEVVILELYSE